jgi:WD40 repeat protein
MQIRDVTTGEVLAAIPVADQGHILAAALSPDSAKVVAVTDTGTGISVRIVEASTGTMLSSLIEQGDWTHPHHASPLHFAAWSPDGTRVVTEGINGATTVWDAITGRALFNLTGYAPSWSPDGKRMVTAGGYYQAVVAASFQSAFTEGNAVAQVFDANTGVELFSLSGPTNPVLDVAWSRDGSRIAASDCHSIWFWNANSAGEETTLVEHQGVVHSVKWSPVDSRVTTVLDDGTARVWDASTGSEILALDSHDVIRVSWSPDGTRIVSTNESGLSHMWDATTGKEIFSYPFHTPF